MRYADYSAADRILSKYDSAVVDDMIELASIVVRSARSEDRDYAESEPGFDDLSGGDLERIEDELWNIESAVSHTQKFLRHLKKKRRKK